MIKNGKDYEDRGEEMHLYLREIGHRKYNICRSN